MNVCLGVLGFYLTLSIPRRPQPGGGEGGLKSHTGMRQQLDSLRAAVMRLDRADNGRGVDTGDRAWVWPHVPALLEAGLACDNLPCDGLGRPPSSSST